MSCLGCVLGVNEEGVAMCPGLEIAHAVFLMFSPEGCITLDVVSLGT